MGTDAKFSSITSAYASGWSIVMKADAVAIANKGTGISLDWLQTRSDKFLMSLLSFKCATARSDPNFNAITSNRYDNWTDEIRNTAITIVNSAAGGAGGWDTNFQELGNDVLMRVLTGSAPTTLSLPEPCRSMHNSPNYQGVVDTAVGAWTNDTSKAAIEIGKQATGISAEWLQLRSNAFLRTLLTFKCTTVRADPNYNAVTAGTISTWTDDTRNTAITILNTAGNWDHNFQASENEFLMRILTGTAQR